jgi:hypothetical protein
MKGSKAIHPPLPSCLRFAFRTIGIVFGALGVIAFLAAMASGKPLPTTRVLGSLLIVVVGTSLVLAFAIYASCRFSAWRVERDGVVGRSLWGRRTRIAWTEVRSVKFFSVEGIPALLIEASSGGREIVAYTLGVDVAAVHAALDRHAGPTHTLTRWFTPPAT